MSQTILDAKEAAKIAVAYVADLLSQDQLRDIRLEEVELPVLQVIEAGDFIQKYGADLRMC